jgi:23S rRNA (uracil1939-C5)-methyltransferase
LIFEFTPQKLVYGGDALGHFQGRTVLVPHALPGEKLEVEEVRIAKGVTYARPLRVMTPAPERVTPPCPYFGRCGGCRYQHLNYESQIAWKREILRETLRRIGRIRWEDDIRIHAAAPWNYRSQAQIKVSQSQGRVELGFYEAESHRLVPVDECKILSPRLNAALGELRCHWWHSLLAECKEIEMTADHTDEKLMLTFKGTFNAQQGETLARGCLDRLSGVETVAVARDSGFTVYGAPAIDYRVADFLYRVSPNSFFQASRFLISELAAAATAGQSGSLALDLYAGVGLFTLPLARAFQQVVGVEANLAAAADLEANAGRHELHNIRVAGESSYDFLRRFAQVAPDLVVVDPPRAGVGRRTLDLLARLGPSRVHYVSCHPPTLARDLGALSHLGYRVISVEMFDFFPQTAHIECLTQLVKSGRGNS